MSKNKKNKITIHTDHDVIKELLTQAFIDAQKATERDNTNRSIEAKAKWKTALGFRDDLSGIRKYWNELYCFMKLISFPKKYQNKSDALGTRFLMMMFLSFVFGLTELICVSYVGYRLYIDFFAKAYSNLLTDTMFGFLLILFSRFFRMARHEVEDLSNKESLYLVFTAVVSFIAMIFTVASCQIKQ